MAMTISRAARGERRLVSAMKRSRLEEIGVAALVLLAVLPSFGQETSQAPLGIALAPESELWIEGGSNIHDWESRTHETRITLMGTEGTETPTSLEAFVGLVRASAITGLSLEVPIGTMTSGKKSLDKKLWKTLKSNDYPTIDYRLSIYEFLNDTTEDTLQVRAIGTITVAGVERPDTLDAYLYADDSGLWLEGSHELRMTMFEIKPPRMMLGALRTHDDFTVFYKLYMVPGEAAVNTQQDNTVRKES